MMHRVHQAGSFASAGSEIFTSDHINEKINQLLRQFMLMLRALFLKEKNFRHSTKLISFAKSKPSHSRQSAIAYRDCFN
jgi:hypothetical protein